MAMALMMNGETYSGESVNAAADFPDMVLDAIIESYKAATTTKRAEAMKAANTRDGRLGFNERYHGCCSEGKIRYAAALRLDQTSK